MNISYIGCLPHSTSSKKDQRIISSLFISHVDWWKNISKTQCSNSNYDSWKLKIHCSTIFLFRYIPVYSLKFSSELSSIPFTLTGVTIVKRQKVRLYKMALQGRRAFLCKPEDLDSIPKACVRWREYVPHRVVLWLPHGHRGISLLAKTCTTKIITKTK